MILCSLIAAALFSTLAPGDTPPRLINGFSPKAAQKESSIEAKLKAGVSRVSAFEDKLLHQSVI